MYIYFLSQKTNRNYDTYGSMVVVAPDENTAKHMHPRCMHWCSNTQQWMDWSYDRNEEDAEKYWYHDHEEGLREWTEPANVQVQLIGIADISLKDTIQIISSSYNAG